MTLRFFQDSSYDAFMTSISELKTMNSKIYPELFEVMSISQIDSMLDDLSIKEKSLIKETYPYGSWNYDPKFVQVKLLQEGLGKLREYREELEETETVVPGFTYYRNIKQFGPRIEGQVCMWLGESRPANWINFIDSSPVMKALEVLKHGDIDDFRKIYIEMANGTPDSLSNIAIQHITESTDEALFEIEDYCNNRWDGPWPWEISAPFKLNRLVEEKVQMRDKTLYELHQMFQELLTEMDEGGTEKFEIISYARNLSDSIQAIIEKFAKIAGESIISFKSQVLTALGDEAAMKVEHGITAPINQCADSLSRLKANVDRLIGELEDHVPSDLDNMGGMGDQMGGAPGGMTDMDMQNPGGEMGDPGMEPEEPDMTGAPAPGGMPPTATPPERPKKMA